MERKGIQAMKHPKFWYVPPAGLRRLFPELIWKTTGEQVLISFDDGPTNFTPSLLDKLDALSIKALFFLRADGAVENRDVVREIIRRGHLIGNHSLTHRKLRFASFSVLQEEVVQSKKILEDLTGTEIEYFRPPYGAFDLRVLKYIKNSGQMCVMWDLLSGDYEGDANLSKEIINKYLNPDSIVVFHDNAKTHNFLLTLLKETTDIIANKKYHTGAPRECLN